MKLTNTQPRLITGPTAAGKTPQWLPGANPLDPEYWREAKKSRGMKFLLDVGYLVVDEEAEAEDPETPPSPAELADLSDETLKSALEDPNVPVAWHPTLEKELERRGG